LTVDDVLAALEASYTRTLAALRRLGPHLDAGPDAGGWTPRQVLSHIIGSWELDAVRMGHFLDQRARDDMRIVPHYHYMKEEYETAPLLSFELALRKAYLGLRVLVQELTPADLALTARSNFGRESTLAEYLVFSAKGHRCDFHTPQLEAFLK
jgi:hypothetical protein